MRRVSLIIYEFDELSKDVQDDLIAKCDLSQIYEEDGRHYYDTP